MSSMKRVWFGVGLAGMVVWMTGCSTTAPILLQLPSEKAGTAEIPLKFGIHKSEKHGSQSLTDISTCTGINCWSLHAKMPRRDEVDYLSKSIGDYLRDAKVFSYCYDQPFDRNDVDLVLIPKLDDVRLYNSGYGTFMAVWAGIPYIGLPIQIGQLLGLPQQLYRAKYKITLVVTLPTGKEIAQYSVDVFNKDAVNIYEQPFGNYMWYNSVFQKAFFSAMDQLVSQMKNDRTHLMQQAAGRATSRQNAAPSVQQFRMQTAPEEIQAPTPIRRPQSAPASESTIKQNPSSEPKRHTEDLSQPVAW